MENSWHWPRDTRLDEDGHRYDERNGVQVMATLRRLAMNALAHDLKGLLELLGWREPRRGLGSA